MPRLLCLLGLAALVLQPGCITVNTFGSRYEPLQESVVYGTSGPRILLLDIDDVITETAITGPLGVGGQESTVARVREQLDHAEKTRVEGILLRINSPGGGVTASDVVYQEILTYKQKHGIPVVAILMGIAASGGYYVAMASDHVIAHPTSITGSIGVIAGGLNFAGLMERYGVGDQTIKAGAFKDAGSPLRPMKPDERAYLQTIVDQLQQRFEQVVAKGRPALSTEQVDTLSDGRIYTAEQAAANGLVDAQGYMPDAIAELERRTQSENVRVVSFHRKREWRANLYSATSSAPPNASLPERLGLREGPAFLYLWAPGL